jgi:hypothetical protein
MNYKETIRHVATFALMLGAIMLCETAKVPAQSKSMAAKKPAAQKAMPRDPFKKYEAVVSNKGSLKLGAPTIQARIERYRAQKMAAAAAHVAPPKPTTALLLSELQVTGIFRTPRGWAAMVEATPIKLSYVVYPGETFFDGQLVAIEETRLVFRHDTVWGDGRRDKSVEIKPLRQPNPIETMTAAPTTAAKNSAPEVPKPGTPEKQ